MSVGVMTHRSLHNNNKNVKYIKSNHWIENLIMIDKRWITSELFLRFIYIYIYMSYYKLSVISIILFF